MINPLKIKNNYEYIIKNRKKYIKKLNEIITRKRKYMENGDFT